jgi:hypothetical protein
LQIFLLCFNPGMMIFWLVVSNTWISFHFIYGMSSFPLTNSIIFQDGFLNHQPVFDDIWMCSWRTIMTFYTWAADGWFDSHFRSQFTRMYPRGRFAGSLSYVRRHRGTEVSPVFPCFSNLGTWNILHKIRWI